MRLRSHHPMTKTFRKPLQVYTIHKRCRNARKVSWKAVERYPHLRPIADKLHLSGGAVDLLLILTLSTPLGTFLQPARSWTTFCKEEPFWLVHLVQSKLRHRRHGRYQISGRWNCECHRRRQEARSSRLPRSQTDGNVQLQ